MSVTTLGSRTGDGAGAALGVVEYLEGRLKARAGTAPGQTPELPRVDDGTGHLVGYYADSVEGPGTWVGWGIDGVSLTGPVDAEALQRVLLGQDPVTGAQLVGARGSALRAEQAGRDAARVATQGPDEELLSLHQAASLLHVSPRYLRRLATETARLERMRARQLEAGKALTPLPASYLSGTHDGRGAHWQVSRAEVRRFAEARRPPAAVVGYDLTFSVPKSVSILWATADPARQAEIIAAIDQAISAGLSYLEDNAAFVQRAYDPKRPDAPRQDKASGLVAASYLHATSRALDPQLHCHVVVANMARRADGQIRALDGRPLYAHAKTAGYLAAAELRAQLTRRLGLEWEPVVNGLADVAGISREAIEEMSKRSADMEALLEDLTAHLSAQARERWLASPEAHQIAAYATRAAKDHGVDPLALRPHWGARLAEVGLDRPAIEACYDRHVPSLVRAEEREELFAEMASVHGLTEMAGTFDRRDVIQYVAS